MRGNGARRVQHLETLLYTHLTQGQYHRLARGCLAALGAGGQAVGLSHEQRQALGAQARAIWDAEGARLPRLLPAADVGPLMSRVVEAVAAAARRLIPNEQAVRQLFGEISRQLSAEFAAEVDAWRHSRTGGGDDT